MSKANFLSVKIKDTVSEVVFGNEKAIRYLTSALLIGGHVLLEGPPGVAKTKLAKTFAASTGLDFSRIQFTPDLMPSDVTGVYIFDQGKTDFRLSPGPVFTDVLLADEVNRTPPKTQAALLEAMQERVVTIDGKTHSLGQFFFVIATQNPIEHEGTYPLPEAQLDRFLFKIPISYPSQQEEIALIKKQATSIEQISGEEGVYQAVSKEEIQDARLEIRQVKVEDSVARYVYEIIQATRVSPDLILGASPRAAISLLLAAKVNAVFEGRDYLIPDDIKDVCRLTLTHRLVVSAESFLSEDGPDEILNKIIETVPVPKSAN